MKPITKAEVEEGLNDREFPVFVIQAFNECIMESRVRNSKNVMQDDVVKRIEKLGNVSRNSIFENHWLDVEKHYRKAGWTVKFDKPAYNESYKAYYTFS
jgi:hypothetical protein